MEEIEGVEHDRVSRPMMKRLERRTSLAVNRHDLPVEQDGVAMDLRNCSRDRRVLHRGILQIPREESDTLALLQRERAVAVPLHLVRPLVAARELQGGSRKHGTRFGNRHSRGRCGFVRALGRADSRWHYEFRARFRASIS